jgi:hypothetical protein
VRRLLEIGEHRIGMQDVTLVDFEFAPISPYENNFLEVLDVAAGRAFAPETECRQCRIDLVWTPAQEEPTRAVSIESLGVAKQLRRAFMLWIDRYRNERDLLTQRRPEFLGDTLHTLCERSAGTRTRGVDEVDKQWLSLERRQNDGFAILIDEGNIRQSSGVGRFGRAASTRDPGYTRYYDREREDQNDIASRALSTASKQMIHGRASAPVNVILGWAVYRVEMVEGFPDGQRFYPARRRAGWCCAPLSETVPSSAAQPRN